MLTNVQGFSKVVFLSQDLSDLRVLEKPCTNVRILIKSFHKVKYNADQVNEMTKSRREQIVGAVTEEGVLKEAIARMVVSNG